MYGRIRLSILAVIAFVIACVIIVLVVAVNQVSPVQKNELQPVTSAVQEEERLPEYSIEIPPEEYGRTWRTYGGQQHGFEFQYPHDWYTQPAGSAIELYLYINSDNGVLGTYHQKTSTHTTTQITGTVRHHEHVVPINAPDEEVFEVVIQELYNTNDLEQEQLTINGVAAMRVHDAYLADASGSIGYVYRKGSDIYTINFDIMHREHSTVDATYLDDWIDAIAQTFTVLPDRNSTVADTEDWQTFEYDTYGYAVDVPQDYTAVSTEPGNPVAFSGLPAIEGLRDEMVIRNANGTRIMNIIVEGQEMNAEVYMLARWQSDSSNMRALTINTLPAWEYTRRDQYADPTTYNSNLIRTYYIELNNKMYALSYADDISEQEQEVARTIIQSFRALEDGE